MTNHSIAMLALAALILAGTAGCSTAGPTEAETEDPAPSRPFKFYCPTCAEPVSWYSYGDYALDRSGDDTTGDNLKELCGWVVHGGHNGGYGDTFQVSSCGSNSEAIVLAWGYNTLGAFRVGEGWTGTTENGIALGVSRDAFLAAYPNFYEVTAETYMLDDPEQPEAQVTAAFDADEKLVSLEVGAHYFSD